MADLILIRHGESLWNLKNLFTGWVDVPLSQKGVDEAVRAGEVLKDYRFDVIYVSTLVRSVETAMIAMAKNTSSKVPVIQHKNSSPDGKSDWAHIYSEATLAETIPVYSAWELNERYYGELQGLNKQETAVKYGDEQVKLWRRSYDVPPPNGEALKNTAERTIPFFKDKIEPLIRSGKTVLVAAHGNSLRSIVMYLENLSREQVLALELKTGDPLRFVNQNGAWARKPV